MSDERHDEAVQHYFRALEAQWSDLTAFQFSHESLFRRYLAFCVTQKLDTKFNPCHDKKALWKTIKTFVGNDGWKKGPKKGRRGRQVQHYTLLKDWDGCRAEFLKAVGEDSWEWEEDVDQ